jgi:uncharacterized protein YjiK
MNNGMTKMLTFAMIATASLVGTAHAGLSATYTTNHDVWKIPQGEGSGITYNWDRDEIVVIGDEGELYAYSPTGLPIDDGEVEVLRFLKLNALDDTEGVAYIGNNELVIAEERRQQGLISADVVDSYLNAETLPFVTFGPTVGNVGLEGVSYDSGDNSLWGVKEKDPFAIYHLQDFRGTNTVVNPFDGSSLGLMDLSDIFVLSNSPFFDSTPAADNLLILSQESKKIVEVTKTGTIVDMMDLAFLNDSKIEGLTVDHDGNLYLVSEFDNSTIYKFAPVPEPTSVALLTGFGALAMVGRRRWVRNGYQHD